MRQQLLHTSNLLPLRTFTYLNILRQMWYECVDLSIIYKKRITLTIATDYLIEHE